MDNGKISNNSDILQLYEFMLYFIWPFSP